MVNTLKGFYGQNAVNTKSLTAAGLGMTSRAMRRRDNNVALNQSDFDNEIGKLINMLIARYTWKGLPCPQYYLEQSLVYSGIAVAFTDDMLGDLLLPCTILERNVYNEPVRVQAIGLDYRKELVIGDGAVLLYDNPMFIPPYIHLELLASRLSDINRTLDTYLFGLKKTTFFACHQDFAQSIKTAMVDVLENRPYILLDSSIADKGGKKAKKAPVPQEIQQLTQFNSPNKATELRDIHAHKQGFQADELNRYGITGSVSADKKAQINDDEVNAGNVNVKLMQKQTTELREQFAKEMSELWGREITVQNNIEAAEKELAKLGQPDDQYIQTEQERD